jgi:hypothetical protein
MVTKRVGFRILAFIIAVVGVSCGGRTGGRGGEVVTIEVDVNTQTDPDGMFEGYEYVALETTPDCLIAEVTQAIVNDDRIYILDRRVGKACFVFDREGKYVGKVQRFGRGPGEYTSIGDIQVYNGLIYLYDRENRAIKVYTESGEFAKEYKLIERFNHFLVVDDNSIWLSAERSNDSGYNFVLYDCASGEYVARVDPFEESDGFVMDFLPLNRTDDGTILATKRFDHTIYSLTEDALTPLYVLKFNTKDQIPGDHDEIPAVDLYDMLSKQWVVQRLKAVTQSDDDLIVAFPETAGGQIFNHLIRYTADGELQHLKLGYNDGKKYPMMSQMVCLGEDFIVTAASAMAALDLEKHYSWGLFDDGSLKIDDNPVLFFWKFR